MNEINYDVVHESILADIFDIIDDVKELKDKGFNVTAGSSSSSYMKSISSATKDLILTFPILVSSDISIDTATKIMAAQEKKCASMLQMLFSVRDYNAAVDGNVMGFLGQFHNNTSRLDMSLADYIGVADRVLGEDYKGVDLEDSGLQYAMEKALCESLSSTVLSSEVNRRALKNFIVENTWAGTTVSEAGNWEPVAPNELPAPPKTSEEAKTGKHDIVGLRAEVPSNQILPSDIKKANELMPTMMTINFVQTNAAREPVCTRTAVLGVKCKLYPVDYSDIENHLISKTQDKNWLISLVKATTSEISFMKDFVLALDKAKIDAKSFGSAGKSNKMWKVLERRAAKSRAKRLMRKANDSTAISTLVLSANIVEDIMKIANINIMKTSTARVILESYNLMCICVVDESMEIAQFLYDTGTDDGFESMSFRGLERDAKDDSYKKIVNLMSKMR